MGNGALHSLHDRSIPSNPDHSQTDWITDAIVLPQSAVTTRDFVSAGYTLSRARYGSFHPAMIRTFAWTAGGGGGAVCRRICLELRIQ